MASPRIPDMFLKTLKRKNITGLTEVGKKEIKTSVTEKETTEIDKNIVPSSETTIENKENTMSSSSSLCLADLITEDSWKTCLATELDSKYMKDVEKFLQRQYEKKIKIFPPREEIFTVFNLIPLNSIRVVILGQDPYHDDGQAHGLSFSVKKGIRPPPSLKNIYKELATDIPGFVAPDHGYLVEWAKQGVFMLNATLTVEAHKANSHAKCGWQKFTDKVINTISKQTEGVVFLLWGGFAHKKDCLIDSKRHAVIKTAHPSPLSARYWWGSKCFSKTNEHLEKFGKKPIDWNRF